MSNLQIKVNVERMWNAGIGPVKIAEELGCSRQYVSYVVNLMGTRERAARDCVGDHYKHLRLVLEASGGRGFAWCVKRP